MSNPLLYATTVLIWGTTWFGITLQLGVVAEEVSVAYRFALAAILLLGWCLVRGRRLRFGIRAHAAMATQGVFLFCANYIVFYHATNYLTSGLLAVLFSTLLYMNVANGALFLGAPVRARVLWGGAVGLAGMGLLFWPELRGLDASADAVRGIGLGLLAVLLVSFGNIASARNQSYGLPVLESNGFAMAYGAAASAAIALARGLPFGFDPRAAYVGSLLYLAVFGTIIAFGCYLTLLGRIGADRAAYAMVLFPVVALGISTALEGFVWTGPAIAGVALVLLGNLVVLGRLRPARAAAD